MGSKLLRQITKKGTVIEKNEEDAYLINGLQLVSFEHELGYEYLHKRTTATI